MSQRPGTPRLLRQLNDRAALELLLSRGPLTRAELGALTGLSKVTSGQLLARLEERGLVTVAGARPGGRGPNAALYAVVSSSAYAAGLEVLPGSVTAGIADITGRTVAEVTVRTRGGHDGEPDPVSAVHDAVRRACETAGIELRRLRAFVIGTRGVVDPATGEVRFSFDLPSWHLGALTELRTTLGPRVIIENDVNLAAVAERSHGAARGVDDFVLLWSGIGQGLGVMLGGRLHRGATGGAGEVGWLPVPGVPLPTGVTDPLSGSFQRLVGGQAVSRLAADHGLLTPTPGETAPPAPVLPDPAPSRTTPLDPSPHSTNPHGPTGTDPHHTGSHGPGGAGPHDTGPHGAGGADTPGTGPHGGGGAGPHATGSYGAGGTGPHGTDPTDPYDRGRSGGGPLSGGPYDVMGDIGALVSRAVERGADGFLDELAMRLAVGVASVSVVLDPGLVVLSGDVGRAGGAALAERVQRAVAQVCPSRPRVAVTEVTGNPILRGAMVVALGHAREEMFATTVEAG